MALDSRNRVDQQSATSGLRAALMESLAAVMASRLLIQGVGAIIVSIFGTPARSRSGFFGTYFNWDSGYYWCVETVGYSQLGCSPAEAAGRMAFFPGYPMASRAAAWMLGRGDIQRADVAALWLISLLGSYAAAVFLYLIARKTHGSTVARGSVVLLLFGPYATFLVASYAEALFLALALAAWWFCMQERYLLAGIIGAAASFTRVNGAFLAVALIVMYIVRQRRLDRPIILKRVASLAVAFGGLFIYAGWLTLLTGKPTAWLDVQHDMWHRSFHWPWDTFVRQGVHIVYERQMDWFIQNVLEMAVAFILLVLLAIMIKRREYAWSLYTLLSIVPFMTSTYYLSIARGSLLIFPLFIVVASWRIDPQRRWLFRAAVVVGAVVLVFNSVQFALGNWAD